MTLRTLVGRLNRPMLIRAPFLGGLLLLASACSGTADFAGKHEPAATGGAPATGGGAGRSTGSGGSGLVTATAGGSNGGGAGTASSEGGAVSGGRSGVAGTTSSAGSGAALGTPASGGGAGLGRAGAGGRCGGGGAGASPGGGGGTGATGGATGATIRNDVFWPDTSNSPIYSQGGGVLKVGDTYYWYGVKYNGAPSYETSQRENSDTSFASVTAYSSKDLANWKFENEVLSASGSGTEIAGSSWIGRLGVAYNANTREFVLVSQYQGSAGTGELFATSATPTGKFTFDHLQAAVTNVANTTTGDQTIFVDDDGSAYVICSSSSGRSNLYVAPLRAADFLNVEPATRIFGGAGREGNAMFKHAGHYYFCSSDLHGWNASHTYCIAATSILGPYGAEFVLDDTDADFSHVTQTGFFVTVTGSSDSFVIFAGDRWADFAGNGLGLNQWMPITFDGDTPHFQSLSEWSIDVASGTFQVGSGNNYALNPSFEADRVTMTQPAGWVTSTTTSGAMPYTNVKDAHTGNWGWQLTSTDDYDATIAQSLTGLPNGSYTLSAWVKSSGGQTQAELYVSGFGASELTSSLTKALSSYTQVSIPGIAVSSGKAELGVRTHATAKQSLTFDDVSFVRTGP